MGFFKSILGGAAPVIGGFLGGPAGAAAGNVLGGFLSRGGNDAELDIGASPDYGNILGTIGAGALSQIGGMYMRDRSAIRGLRLDESFRRARMHEEWNFYRSQGLTPHEIKGIGGLGGAGGASGAGQVLGRTGEASAEAMLRVRENQLERESRERIAGAQVAAQMHATDTMAGTAERKQAFYETEKFPEDKKLIRAQTADRMFNTRRALRDAEIREVLHSERWPRMFAGMSAENIITSLMAAMHGVDIKEILSGTKIKQGTTQYKAAESMLNEAKSYGSKGWTPEGFTNFMKVNAQKAWNKFMEFDSRLWDKVHGKLGNDKVSAADEEHVRKLMYEKDYIPIFPRSEYQR